MKTTGSFLPHIEGMRALAVVAVIINHIWHDALPGGYLGVDIFFVISGFVITRSMLAREQSSILSGLAWFYVRRIKRILPALIVVVPVSIALLRMVNPDPLSATLTGVGALFGVSNVFLYLIASDYFGDAITMNPLMHTWSLGVEEQFYFVFPLLFFLLAGQGRHPRRSLTVVIGSASLVSALAYAVMFHAQTSAVYYLVPFRAWELGVGCLIALAWGDNLRSGAVVQGLAVAMIAAAFVVGDSAAVASTFLAVSGSAALIWSGGQVSAVQRTLNHRAAQYVGRLSYSLYLWHWPVICLFVWTLGVRAETILPILLLTGLFSVLSFHIVEEPARRASWFARPGRDIAAGLAVATLIALGLGGMHKVNLPPFTGTRDAALASDGYTPGTITRFSERSVSECLGLRVGTDARVAEAVIDRCTAETDSPVRLVFFGDSHSLDMFGVGEVLYRDQIATVTNFGQPGCRAPSLEGEPPYCAYTETVLDAFGARPGSDRPDWIVLRSNYTPRAIDGTLGDYMPRIEAFVEMAGSRGMGVIFVAPAPKFAALDEGGLCVAQWFRPEWALSERCISGFGESRQEQRDRGAGFFEALKALERTHDNFAVFDPFDALCGPDTETCTAIQDGKITYRDGSHITEAGAEILGQAFASFLSQIESNAGGPRDEAQAPNMGDIHD